MSKRIKIIASNINVIAELTGKNPKTAKAIWEALPIVGKVNRWGEEIYFRIPVEIAEENPREIVDVGDLGYWPPGKAFCIFFGKTPISKGDEIRPASPVNVFGRIEGDPKIFKDIRGGETIQIERE
jgi:hypothetical protein